MRFPRKLFKIIPIILLAGCASSSDIGKAWVGYPEEKLLTQWGAPSRTAKAGEKTIHTWERRNGYGKITCQQTMVISPTGYVVDHSSDCGIGRVC
jgi:hypothetical protein